MENTEEIDYFKGVTNEQLVKYYRRSLFSRTELINYTYPNEFYEEDGGYWEHFNRCDGILYERLYIIYDNNVHERWREQKEIENQQLEKGEFLEYVDVEMIEISAEEKAALHQANQQKREEIVRNKRMELSPELAKLIDEYMEIAIVTDVDLRTDEDYENASDED